ncbi:MAG: hypothetical protein K6F68_05150 [Clostridiales bacterium]|nr:hypothetical protein [Clostridiales bacterium]
MKKPKLTKEIMRSEYLRAEYVHDVIDYLADKWDMNRILNEPAKPITATARRS